MYNFFFSYSRDANIEIIEKYIECLEYYGFKVWYDKVDVILGKNIDDELYNTLCQCEHWNGIILFLDKTYFSKEWCLKELDYSLNNKITLYPILLNISKKDIPIEYRELNDLNLCTIRTKNDIQYAIYKTLYLYIKTVCPPAVNFKLTNHLTLKYLIETFMQQNQQDKNILFTCDNIALCIRYLLSECNNMLSNDAKFLYNIIHTLTRKYYVEGNTTRFQIRIVVTATQTLINLYC